MVFGCSWDNFRVRPRQDSARSKSSMDNNLATMDSAQWDATAALVGGNASIMFVSDRLARTADPGSSRLAKTVPRRKDVE